MPKQRKVLAVCCGTHIQHDGMLDMLYPLLPLLAQSFGLSYAEVGLVRAANKMAMAGFQLPAGLLAERLGSRGLLAFGTIGAGAAYLLLGFSAGYLSLLMVLFLAGCGNAVQHPLCASMVSGAYGGDGRRGALGTYNFFGDVGKLTFAGLASLAVGAGYSWNMTIQAAGISGVVVGIALYYALRSLDVGGRPDSPAIPGATQAAQDWGIRDRTGFAALCGIAVVDASTRTGFLTFIAFLLIERGLAESWAALAVVMVFSGGMVGKLACGFLANRIGVIRTVIVTELGTGIGILMILWLPNMAAFYLLPFIGVALNGTSSVLYGTIGDLVDENRQQRAFGLFYTLGSVCGILAPLGYGLLGDVFDIPTTMAVIGCVIFLTIPLCLVLRASVNPGESRVCSGTP
jgi:MFS family permease